MSDKPPDSPLTITVTRTEEFFLAGPIPVRAWRGTTGADRPVIALIAGLQMDKSEVADDPGLISIPPPVPEWPVATREAMGAVWRMASRLDESEIAHLLGFVTARAAYRDDQCVEQKCQHCQKPYRGPAMYCSFACAVEDA